jgi:glycosyltransferase involved in cell wall biosynthesis
VIADRALPTRSRDSGGVAEAPRPLPSSLSVVIPAWNEEDGIAAIVERVWSVGPALAEVGVTDFELLVVDDGSRDRTAEVAGRFPFVKLVRHPVNRGYGAAIKTGFAQARGELVAFLDADGTYPPENLPALCRVAREQGADVVVGSRRSGAASEMPPVRRVGNFVWSSLVSVIGNHRVADPASGMRVLQRSALAHLYPLPDGLHFTPVMSTRAVHEGLKVVEVPVAYSERVGRSKLSVIKDGTRFLTTILWTSLEYNPVRLLGMVGATALGAAGLILLSILAQRLQGVTELGPWGAFGVFAALVLAVAGVSIFSLGATFNYLVSLFHRRPVRQGLFGRPIFDPPLDRHFGWIGLLAGGTGTGVAVVSLALSQAGEWDIARLWLWLVASALLVLVGLQLVVSWVVLQVLDALNSREPQVEEQT